MRLIYQLSLVAALCTPLHSFSQEERTDKAEPDSVNVRFNKEKQTVKRQREDDLIIKFTVKADGLEKNKEYKVAVKVDPRSTLAGPAYELEVPFTTIKGGDDGTENSFYLTIKADSLPDRQRVVTMNVTVTDKDGKAVPNKGAPTELEVLVDGAAPALDQYNYLAYIGTNFDLVDGVQTNNLFFATNLFLPRSAITKHGLFLSLYGNRAITAIDSSSNANFISAAKPLTDSTYVAYYKRGQRLTTFSADNIGAYISPFFRLGKLSDEDAGVRYHFAPALEFVWRRTTRTTTYTDLVPTDTVERAGTLVNSVLLPEQYVQKENRFEFKVGPGLFISHDNENISVHIYACVGYSTLYIPDGMPTVSGTEPAYVRQHDVFFSGRAWITEPKLGLTIQAEIVNTVINPRPYYVVTLSKAFSFRNLGSVLQPITAR